MGFVSIIEREKKNTDGKGGNRDNKTKDALKIQKGKLL